MGNLLRCPEAQAPSWIWGTGWGKGRIERRSDGERGSVGEGKSVGKGRDEAGRVGKRTGNGKGYDSLDISPMLAGLL